MKLKPKNKLYIALGDSEKNEVNATETFISKAIQVHGYRFDYSKSAFKSHNEHIEVVCHLHGSFFITPNSHVAQKADCPYCARKRFTPALFNKIMNQIHIGMYKYHDIDLIQYRKSTDVIKIECCVHGVFYQRLDVHLNGHGCLECAERPYNHFTEARYKIQELSVLGQTNNL